MPIVLEVEINISLLNYLAIAEVEYDTPRNGIVDGLVSPLESCLTMSNLFSRQTGKYKRH